MSFWSLYVRERSVSKECRPLVLAIEILLDGSVGICCLLFAVVDNLLLLCQLCVVYVLFLSVASMCQLCVVLCVYLLFYVLLLSVASMCW